MHCCICISDFFLRLVAYVSLKYPFSSTRNELQYLYFRLPTTVLRNLYSGILFRVSLPSSDGDIRNFSQKQPRIPFILLMSFALASKLNYSLKTIYFLFSFVDSFAFHSKTFHSNLNIIKDWFEQCIMVMHMSKWPNFTVSRKKKKMPCYWIRLHAVVLTVTGELRQISLCDAD